MWNTVRAHQTPRRLEIWCLHALFNTAFSRQTCVVPTDQAAYSIIVIYARLSFSLAKQHIQSLQFHARFTFRTQERRRNFVFSLSFDFDFLMPYLYHLWLISPPVNPVWASLAWGLLSSPQAFSLNKDAQTDSLVVDLVCRGVWEGHQGIIESRTSPTVPVITVNALKNGRVNMQVRITFVCYIKVLYKFHLAILPLVRLDMNTISYFRWW